MARSNIVVALATTSMILCTLFYAFSTFGFPHVDFLRWHPTYDQSVEDTQQSPLFDEAMLKKGSKGNDLFMLGVGKADITGLVEIWCDVPQYIG